MNEASLGSAGFVAPASRQRFVRDENAKIAGPSYVRTSETPAPQKLNSAPLTVSVAIATARTRNPSEMIITKKMSTNVPMIFAPERHP
jgi:hypothetical protein